MEIRVKDLVILYYLFILPVTRRVKEPVTRRVKGPVTRRVKGLII